MFLKVDLSLPNPFYPTQAIDNKSKMQIFRAGVGLNLYRQTWRVENKAGLQREWYGFLTIRESYKIHSTASQTSKCLIWIHISQRYDIERNDRCGPVRLVHGNFISFRQGAEGRLRLCILEYNKLNFCGRSIMSCHTYCFWLFWSEIRKGRLKHLRLHDPVSPHCLGPGQRPPRN